MITSGKSKEESGKEKSQEEEKIGLVWLLISRIVKAIKSTTKRGDEI